MARRQQTANLESRESRRRLPLSHRPYRQVIDRNCHLGYYKGGDMQIWIAYFLWGKRPTVDRRIGLADDVAAADGIQVLDFGQAKRAAQNWCAEQAIREAAAPIDDSPFNKVGPACNRI